MSNCSNSPDGLMAYPMAYAITQTKPSMMARTPLKGGVPCHQDSMACRTCHGRAKSCTIKRLRRELAAKFPEAHRQGISQ